MPESPWLTTEYVKKEYNFDPTPYLDDPTVSLRNAFHPVYGRLWYIDDIASLSKNIKYGTKSKNETLVQRINRTVQEQLRGH